VNAAPSRRARRAIALVAGLTASALALSGCLYSMIPESTPLSSASPTADTSGVSADLLPFYSQTLEWTDCGGGLDCATVTAPLNWDDPSQGEIDLAIARSRALSGSPLGSLLTNPGGPGASGVDYMKQSPSYLASAALLNAYDVVSFDPRGVGASTAVRCYDAADMDAYLFDIPAAARGTDAWEAEVDAANADFAAACDANSDGILPYISTEQAARDMDLMRAVLGDDKLDYLGYSYGTFLGATYAKLYPERVGRFVLDGAMDPSIADVGSVQAAGFESALRAYMDDCLAGSDCPFRGTVDDAMSDLSALLQSVDRAPIPAADGRMLGADALMSAIATALYSQDMWTYLSQALTGVLQGDPSLAFTLVDFYFDRSGGQYTSNTTEAFAAYNCMDYPPLTDEQETAAEAYIEKNAPTIAPYWQGPDLCDHWAAAATGVREKITAPGAAPIVVVGTTNDPATPYAWAESLADQLSSGVLVTRVGEGHLGYMKGNACVDAAVEGYLLDGTVPEDGLVCQ
jgi:pimeloyl-ACP methyl ester carboxylesterase